MIVINWRGWKPPPYDPVKHAPCATCGFRIRWWGTQCTCPKAEKAGRSQ